MFTASMWNNRAKVSLRTLCLQCCRPPCAGTDCKTCRICRDPACRDKNCVKSLSSLNVKELPKTIKDVQNFYCTACRFPCDVCGETKGKDGYPPSMWQNRSKRTQRTLCFRCCRPPCSSKTCKTCAVCRDPNCKRRKCDSAIQPLNARNLPRSIDEVEQFLCATCRNITCQCGKTMSATMQKRMKAELGKHPYVCVDCQDREMRRNDAAVKVKRSR